MEIFKNRKIVIATVVVLVAIFGTIILANSNSNNNGNGNTRDITTDKDDYFDPNSRETISNPEGKTPENYGYDSAAPTFFGTANLLDYGVAAEQESDAKWAIFQYFNGKKEKVSEVSVVLTSITPVEHDRDSTSTRDTINYDIVVDRKTTYHVRMDYFDLSSIQLYMTDTNGTQIYDSGVVSNQSL